MLFMAGPNTRETNPRWRTAAILNYQKRAYRPSKHVYQLKISSFKIPDGGRRHLEN